MERRGREKNEWSERASERERERKRGHTHYLNARHSERRLVRSRALLSWYQPSSSSSYPRAAVRSYQIFSFFFPLFFFSLPPSPLTPPRLSLSLSTGVSRVLVSDHRQVDNLFGAEGEEGGKRESVVPLSSVPSVNGTSQWGF